MNLNDIAPDVDGHDQDEDWLFRSQSHGHDAIVDVFFDDLAGHLCERLRDAHFVAGCMAWFTNYRVLDAMSRLPGGCQVVVQKEDFLRPDGSSKLELQRQYAALTCPERGILPTRTTAGPSRLSYASDQTCDAVRCMGVRPHRFKTTPKMHHKFFVMFDEQTVPFAVWTGSFNATENGSRSRENAVYLRGAKLAALYATEWSRVLALSEPLDWSSEYVAPEWRFGS